MERDEDFSDHVALVDVSKQVLVANCKRCNRSWNPKSDRVVPKRCAKCNSPYWNKDRLRTGDAGAPNKYGFDTWELNKWYVIPSFQGADGNADTQKNETRWRSLAQFARRRGLVAYFDQNQPPLSARVMLIKQ